MYPTNPMNDYYLRQPYQQQFNFPPAQPQIRANFVSSVEEARASQIDFLSTSLFCDTASGKIYLKKIGDNGKPIFLTYKIEEEPDTDPLAQINARLSNIENFLGGLRNESVSNKGVLTDDSYSIILPKIPMFAPKDCIIKINAADIDKIISYIQTMPMA